MRLEYLRPIRTITGVVRKSEAADVDAPFTTSGKRSLSEEEASAKPKIEKLHEQHTYVEILIHHNAV